MKKLVTAFDGDSRCRASTEFLKQLRNHEVLVVAGTRASADELVRRICAETGSVFGVRRFSLLQLAVETATERLVAAGKTLLAGVAVDALAARAVHECRIRAELQWFDSVARTAGFFRALAATLSELRLNGIKPEQLEHSTPSGKDLSHLLLQYSRTLDEGGLADAASIYSIAITAVRDGRFFANKLPVLFFDVTAASYLEQEFVRALASQSDDIHATAHSRDEETIRVFSEAFRAAPAFTGAGGGAATALDRLRHHVFELAAPPPAATDSTVDFVAATDENRECVEIARSILAVSRTGMPFDRMTVLLRNPELYQPLLEDGFRRAGIPAFFTHGARRPNPAGRAFLTLLACASEKLSALRFSEYLSLAQVPNPPDSEKPPSPGPWVPPQGELFAGIPAVAEQESQDTATETLESPVIAGTLRSPRHWERLLVDAAVIGGYDRWVRRLEGLQNELRTRIQELGTEEEPVRARLEQNGARLENLQKFALPIVKFLSELPESATWSQWLSDLEKLASMAIRQPETVLTVLAELRPMSAIGPVTLDEVREALSDRLRFLRTEPTERRYGKVFVATIPEIVGMSFELVFIPGLGEDIFPRKSFEDPLLLDVQRAAISPYLATQDTRVRRERMLLHLAASAARSRLWISYPRMDLGQGRARGPSFYALDVFRAITGQIPELRTLEQRAGSQSQIGWPAPRDPAAAIDDAEYDLAVISAALRKPAADVRGMGRYLVEASPALARSLRARWSRWEKSWSPYDGTNLQQTEPAFALLQQHRLSSRPYSATALQQFAMCPYRFVLYSIYKLQPREDTAALERLDPLTRGRLFHEVQFQLLSKLKAIGLLPVTVDNQKQVLDVADEVLDRVAGIYSEELSPAIPSIWDSEIEEVRWDLRGWIRQIVLAPDSSHWKPAWFELAFGIGLGPEHDPDSCSEPITLANGIRVRGAIDLVEENGGAVRITDHKTGKAPQHSVELVGNGEILQPLLYAHAAEAILGKKARESRLFYCTENGGYRITTVSIDDHARETLNKALGLIEQSIGSGFLPAAPREDACLYCDYHMVCGPYEELRVRRKPKSQLASLNELREMP
jgi:ATP-dependent helicase/DNAse subunit B